MLVWTYPHHTLCLGTFCQVAQRPEQGTDLPDRVEMGNELRNKSLISSTGVGSTPTLTATKIPICKRI